MIHLFFSTKFMQSLCMFLYVYSPFVSFSYCTELKILLMRSVYWIDSLRGIILSELLCSDIGSVWSCLAFSCPFSKWIDCYLSFFYLFIWLNVVYVGLIPLRHWMDELMRYIYKKLSYNYDKHYLLETQISRGNTSALSNEFTNI